MDAPSRAGDKIPPLPLGSFALSIEKPPYFALRIEIHEDATELVQAVLDTSGLLGLVMTQAEVTEAQRRARAWQRQK